jgi:hypothetical protein
VFVHHTSIHNDGGFKSLGEGEEVEFDLLRGPKGMQAGNVTGPGGHPVKGDPNAGKPPQQQMMGMVNPLMSHYPFSVYGTGYAVTPTPFDMQIYGGNVHTMNQPTFVPMNANMVNLNGGYAVLSPQMMQQMQQSGQMMHPIHLVENEMVSPISPKQQELPFSPFGPVVYGTSRPDQVVQHLPQQYHHPQQIQQIQHHQAHQAHQAQPQSQGYGAMRQSVSQSSIHSTRTQDHSPSLVHTRDVSPSMRAQNSNDIWTRPNFSPFDTPLQLDLYSPGMGRGSLYEK